MISKCVAFVSNKSSPAAKLVREANAIGAQCSVVLPPQMINPGMGWKAGQWDRNGIFILQPRSYLPTKSRWPFNTNSVWNGSEFASRPRVGSVLREAGFDQADLVIVEHFCLIPAIRFLQPKALMTLITSENIPSANDPVIIQKRWREVAEDSDIVCVEQGLERKLKFQAELPLLKQVNLAEKNWERDCLQSIHRGFLAHER